MAPSLLRRGGTDEALRSVLDQLEDPGKFLAKIDWLFDHPEAETRDEVRFRDGRVFERWSAPVVGADGASYGRGWYFRDITERRRQEAALEEAYGRLREQERFRAQLIHNIGHDLATPLTALRLQLHLLERALGRPSEAQARSLGTLKRSLGHPERLVEDLLDVARLEAGRLRLAPEPLDLAELAAQGDIALRAEPAGPLRVVADAHRIRQVLFNLLSNATKFTPRGGSVLVRAGAEGNEARVRVEDTGRGLNPEQLARLFKPSSRVAEAEGEGTSGTGLGLSISNGLVEAHGGPIWAESPGRGRGAAFTLALPLAAREPGG